MVAVQSVIMEGHEFTRANRVVTKSGFQPLRWLVEARGFPSGAKTRFVMATGGTSELVPFPFVKNSISTAEGGSLHVGLVGWLSRAVAAT